MTSNLPRKPDLWFGAIGICLSIFLFAQTQNLSAGAVNDSVGAPFFPRLLSGLLFVLCALLIFRTRKSAAAEGEYAPIGPAITTIIILAVYTVAMPYVGYFPATTVLIAGILWIAGMRKVTSIAFVVAILVAFQFAVFDRLFGVLFPPSSLMG